MQWKDFDCLLFSEDQLHIFNHKGPSVIGEKESDG